MIESFASKRLERFFNGDQQAIGAQIKQRVTNILAVLMAAETLEDLDIPGYRTHPLKGDKKDFFSIRVTGNWRIVFRFQDGKASDVDLLDYH